MKYLKKINEFFGIPWIDKIPSNTDKTLLKEFMKKVANEMGEELVEKKGDVSGSYVGSGSFGSAFKTKSGKILKLTVDKMEAYRSWKLSKKPTTMYLMNYYDVRFIQDKEDIKFAILMDAVKPLKTKEKTFGIHL